MEGGKQHLLYTVGTAAFTCGDFVILDLHIHTEIFLPLKKADRVKFGKKNKWCLEPGNNRTI